MALVYVLYKTSNSKDNSIAVNIVIAVVLCDGTVVILCVKIDRNVFETTLNKLNEFYADAEALSARTYCENCFACLTAYIVYLCMDTHYEKVLFTLVIFACAINVSCLLIKSAYGVLLTC